MRALKELMPGGDLFHTAVLALLCGTPVESRHATFTWDPASMYPVVHDALEASAGLVRELGRDQAEALLARRRGE